jgi:hypothetical protein
LLTAVDKAQVRATNGYLERTVGGGSMSEARTQPGEALNRILQMLKTHAVKNLGRF